MGCFGSGQKAETRAPGHPDETNVINVIANLRTLAQSGWLCSKHLGPPFVGSRLARRIVKSRIVAAVVGQVFLEKQASLEQ